VPCLPKPVGAICWHADGHTDQRPAYYYDFGNLRLTAAELTGFGRPTFHFGGVWRGANSISMVDFDMPLEVESLEQGAAWIAYGIICDDGRAGEPRNGFDRSLSRYAVS
jgi:hypothetical protein